MDKHELERRTKKFAVSVILFVEELLKKKLRTFVKRVRTYRHFLGWRLVDGLRWNLC